MEDLSVEELASNLSTYKEQLHETAGHGSVHSYFIQALVRENPPHRIFKIKGGDHCPFLLEITQIQAPATLLPGSNNTSAAEEIAAESS